MGERHYWRGPTSGREIACDSGYIGDSHSQWKSAWLVVGAGISVQAR
jgi:hypothetical protein